MIVERMWLELHTRIGAQADDVVANGGGHRDETIVLLQEPTRERLIEKARLVRHRIVHDTHDFHPSLAQRTCHCAHGRREEGHPVTEHSHVRLRHAYILSSALPCPRTDGVQNGPRHHIVPNARINLRCSRKKEFRILPRERERCDRMILFQLPHQRCTELRDATSVRRESGEECEFQDAITLVTEADPCSSPVLHPCGSHVRPARRT